MRLSRRQRRAPLFAAAALWLCFNLILPTAARADDEGGENRGRSCRYVNPVWEKSDFGKQKSSQV